MAVDTRDLALIQFESEVHQEFQAGSSLTFKELARTRMVKGKEVRFPVMGKSVMKEHVMGSPIAINSSSRSQVTATLKNFSVGEYSDLFNQAQINFDEKQELAKSLGMSAQRKGVQLIIDELAASTSTLAVANDISGSADNLTVDAVRKAGELLNKNNVPFEDRVLLVSASGMAHLTEDPEVSSRDYFDGNAMSLGYIRNFYGFDVHMIGDMDEGGLPLSGSARTCFAYSKQALGFGVNMEPKIRADYDPQFAADLVTCKMSGIAKEIDASGIVTITTAE